MVTIIDYGLGNLGSILNMLKQSVSKPISLIKNPKLKLRIRLFYQVSDHSMQA